MTIGAESLRLGARLKAARTGNGLTISQLATAAGLSTGFISRVERDETLPSVPTLVALCDALALPVGALFETPYTNLVRAGEGHRVISLSDGGAEERLVSPKAETSVEVLRSSMPPHTSASEELYSVDADVQIAHVFSGALTILFSGSSVTLFAGDTLTFAAREPHSWRNDTDDPCEVVWIISPAPWSGNGRRKRKTRG